MSHVHRQASHSPRHRARWRPVRLGRARRDHHRRRDARIQGLFRARPRGAGHPASRLLRRRDRGVRGGGVRRHVRERGGHPARPAQAGAQRRRRLDLRARAVRRPHERLQGRGPADAASPHGAHRHGRQRGREDHDRDRHLRRYRQGGARRIRRRAGLRHHRVLPRGQGQPRAGAPDDHAGGRETSPSAASAATSMTPRAP